MSELKPTILYVDDEEGSLAAFKSNYRTYYNVLTCDNTEAAQKILETEDVRLIIADQNMPKMTGLQFIDAIRESYPSLIKIILTGYSDIDAIIQSINSGLIIRYLLKPWNEHELKQAIDTGLKIWEQEKENTLMISRLQAEIAKQKGMIEVLQKFVPYHILQETLESTSSQSMKVKIKNITVLFSDIRGFTTFSSSRTPEETVAFLNFYFTRMGKCITDHHGMIDKFLGDGLLAFFGVLEGSETSELDAIDCARHMILALNEFNKKDCPVPHYEAKIGIGIHTGPVALGNIGSETRYSYTGIGQTIDLACEVEHFTHSFHNTILISNVTYEAVKAKIQAQKCDLDIASSLSPITEIYQVL